MKRAFSAGLIIAVFGVVIGLSSAVAQVSQISPDQMRQWQALPDAQKQQLLEQLGISQMPTAPVASPTSVRLPDTAAPATTGFPAAMPSSVRIHGGESIVVHAKLRLDIEPDEVQAFLTDNYRSRLLGSHFIQLDSYGVMDVPGIAAIPLAGLSEREVAIRLQSEPLLAQLNITVTILPLTPIGTAALELFGYGLFSRGPGDVYPGSDQGALAGGTDVLSQAMGLGDILGMASFSEQSIPNVPAPRDYVLGPGDAINVQLYGNENREIQLIVNNDGTINFPKLGPKSVVGLTFGELKELIEQRMDEQMIGTEASISMGVLRSIRVFVLGDVHQPGAYSMNSLSRITNALFHAYGITEIGSLRKIELKRDGRTIKTLDLYDLLLRGDTSNDAQLRSDDVVFIPPVKNLVGVGGEVRRPAIYELKNEKTVEQLLDLAGGLRPTADTSTVELQRVSQRGARSIETIDLMKSEDLQFQLNAGDLLTIHPVLEEVQDAVFLKGHTNRPGAYEWWPGMTISDLLPSEVYLKPMADLSYVLVRREEGLDRRASVLSTDIEAVWSGLAPDSDIPLQARDRVIVFESGVGRTASVRAVLKELEGQSTYDEPNRIVKIGGQIRAPGAYPLEVDMRVSDLLRAGAGLNASAYAVEAELTRYVIDATGERRTNLIPINLAAVLGGDASADMLLESYDSLSIMSIPDWGDMFDIEIVGEVRFPGRYPVRHGETLASILQRAGGLTELAFTPGAVFTRDTLRQREEEQLKLLVGRLESDIAGLQLRAASDPSSDAQQAVSAGEALLTRARSTEATGRLVIELDDVVGAEPGEEGDIDLRKGDKLLIPRRAQEVTVMGEVQYTTSHLYAGDRSRDGYLDLSGGLTLNADKKRIYVVRANGAVQASGGSRWFGGKGSRIYPGDTIVVPADTDRTPKLVQWTSITQVLYQMAIAVAAVNSF